MGKHEPGTPKFIANKMKSKGLQKLRWYCQMCQKQCRDENGFKCHTTSESHQRNLLMFADNTKKYLDEFSTEFLDGFMDLLRRQFGTKRIAANKVYQDYIADKHHVHMNSTRWLSLTGFVKWLGRTGKCVVDETEKGWFISYIDRDPETLAREEKKNKKQKMDKDDEEKLLEFVEKQVQRGQTQESEDTERTPSELVRKDGEEKISLQLQIQPTKKTLPIKLAPSSSKTSDGVFLKPSVPTKRVQEESIEQASDLLESSKKGTKRKIEDEEDDDEKPWLAKGIVVKIMTDALGSKYYEQKGVIEKLIDEGFQAVVRTLSSNHKLKLDQSHLRTVIPQLSKPVMILKGEYRGTTAFLKDIDIERCIAFLEIGSGDKRKLKKYSYDTFSKIHQA